MEEILHKLRQVVYPIIYDGFCAVQDFWTINYVWKKGPSFVTWIGADFFDIDGILKLLVSANVFLESMKKNCIISCNARESDPQKLDGETQNVFITVRCIVQASILDGKWLIKGSLEVKLPTIWRDEKQSREVESEEDTGARKPEERRYKRAKC